MPTDGKMPGVLVVGVLAALGFPRVAHAADGVGISLAVAGTPPVPALPPRRTEAPPRPSDSIAIVRISEESLTRLRAAVELWRQQPARIRDTLAQQPEYQQTVTVVVTDVKGLLLPATFKTPDMVRLAAAVPAVAALLRTAKLTALQMEQHMRALYLAVLTDQVDRANQRHGEPATPAHRSVTWQNVEFLRAHPAMLEALRAAGMSLPTVVPKQLSMASDTVNQHPY